MNHVLTIEEQLAVDLAIRAQLELLKDETIPYLVHERKILEDLLKQLQTHRLAVIGVY